MTEQSRASRCLSNSGDDILVLGEADSLAIASALDPTPSDTEAFVASAALAFHAFPLRVREAILRFARFGTHSGCLLVRGLPSDADPAPTPPEPRPAADVVTSANELCLVATATGLGEPVAYAQEKHGSMFQDVLPTRRNEEEWSSESSKIFLPFHTEMAFHPFLPSFVLLACIRPDPGASARTVVSSIRDIYPRLSATQRALAWAPVYNTGIDYSFGRPTGQRGGGRTVSLCHGAPDDPYFCFDPGLMTSTVPEGIELIQTLENIAHEEARSVALLAGDLLIIDNRRAVHARTAFPARYDGTDRWLVRLLAVDSLAPSAADRPLDGRVIATSFDGGVG